MNLGQFIKQKRLENNLTMEELGEKIGKNKVYISRLENNKVKTLKHDLILPLCDALGIKPTDLFENFDEFGNYEEVTPNDFMKEVFDLLDKVNNISEKEKDKIKADIKYICGDDE